MRRIVLAILAGLLTTGLVGFLVFEHLYNAAFDFADAVWGRNAGIWWFGKIIRTTQAIVIAGAGVVVTALIAYRRPVAANACKSCGYNLRGNVSGTCPECGERA